MKQVLKDIFYSFPIQLFILHFRKYQVLLVFWYLLASTINSVFLKTYGADALFLSPEYLGSVNTLGAFIVGIALGIYVMSWNVTTFIMHSKRCKFLATTRQPFLIYCINNAVFPLLFILFYFVKLYHFDSQKELMQTGGILLLMAGILGGFFLLIFISFAFFFGAEKRIRRALTPIVVAEKHLHPYRKEGDEEIDAFGMRVSYFFSSRYKLRKVRSVSHYSQDFLDLVFKRHHFSGIVSIILAFAFLTVVGFHTDDRIFQVPAAASILIFFSVMMAVIGALTYFLQSWSLPFAIVLIFALNFLYQKEILDPRNKAYGVNYQNKDERPSYDRATLLSLCDSAHIKADRLNMLSILEQWKKRQTEAKPVMIFVSVSGGGLRSGTFVMNTLQKLDSITHRKFFDHCVMISGASGGMLAATYYRELYRRSLTDPSIKLYDSRYTDNIAKDILNPVFSSMVARDIFAPAQKFSVNGFKYVKDRGYAFEQKLLANTDGILDNQLKDYSEDERMARIPIMIFNSTITRDGRRMMVCTQPISFLMKSLYNVNDTTTSPDAVDFAALFSKQGPLNMRLLTALRMNATFPYVLPNVWLPSEPVIDVMDAGLRDNFGGETVFRFIENFKDWIRANTGGVIFVQLRDRMKDNWQAPVEGGSITDVVVKPATMLQYNWYKIQDYSESNQFSYLKDAMDSSMHGLTFMYVPQKEDNNAALNFHISESDKRDVINSFNNAYNQEMLNQLLKLLK